LRIQCKFKSVMKQLFFGRVNENGREKDEDGERGNGKG
jgi:hypothetical protein